MITEQDDDLTIPAFLRRKKSRKQKVDLSAPVAKIDWAPIRHTARRSDMLENMRRLAKRPEAPVVAILRGGYKDMEKRFRNMDDFLDNFFNEKVHRYLGLYSDNDVTRVNVDISGEMRMKQRFADLKTRRNPAPVVSKRERVVDATETVNTGETEMADKKAGSKAKVKTKSKAKTKTATKVKAKVAKEKPAKAPKEKPVKPVVSDARFDGKKLTRILQRDLPEGTKALQKTSPHWTAYIYIARKPGVTFDTYANSAKHSVTSLAFLVEAGHVVLK